MTLQEISVEHGWEEEDYRRAKAYSVVLREFKEGAVILSDMGTYYILSSFHKNNYYTLSMWRVIVSILTNYRDKPIMVGFVDNEHRLMRASIKYNCILSDDGIVIFPKQEKVKDE